MMTSEDLANMKPSALLRLVVADCLKVAKMKTRRFAMGQWLSYEGRTCYVCMAGAVMDRSLGEKTDRCKFATWAWDVNGMRTGNFWCAEIVAVDDFNQLIRDHYSDRLGRAPWRIYLRGADLLEKAAL